jgi:hypothetical protein
MENVRIDKGVKRGPKNKHKLPTRPQDRGTWVIPAELKPDEVLDRYLTEQSTSQIAASYGLSRKAMVAWLKEKAPEQWKRVQVLRALMRKEDGDEGLEVASDALSLARARELLRSAQWDLERLDSNIYGQKQHVTVDINVDLGDRLMRAEQRAIPGEYTQVVTDPSQSCDKSLIDKDSNKPA